MAKRIGILTSGGDCPGLNATIRGVAKAAYEQMEGVEIVGIAGGFSGLIKGEYREMKPSEFSGILNVGGTILGTVRTPFKNMRKIEDDKIDKVANMVHNYEKMKLDCLCTLGGNGTHKTANLLSEEGLNIVGLPKTIDNDIWGTDVTFGFHTAVDIATDVIDRLHTTAASHGRVMIAELMGNKAGWLTLYAGLAGGADVVIIPEIPYSQDAVLESVYKRAEGGKAFSIIAIAEGALRKDEAGMKKKEIRSLRAAEGVSSAAERLTKTIETETGIETRLVVPGHMQRGGSPSAYDRILATKFGVHAAQLINHGKFGYTVALQSNKLTENKLKDIAGKTKYVSPASDIVKVARSMGMSLGD
ncbi:6-phosphofructokinase [Christensenellaceae bacterium OttesenSCG-928-K19]|nr:6-phosphofructokinase [Christensenellaceae bacterium OttesenSCG-928-K19]